MSIEFTPYEQRTLLTSPTPQLQKKFSIAIRDAKVSSSALQKLSVVLTQSLRSAAVKRVFTAILHYETLIEMRSALMKSRSIQSFLAVDTEMFQLVIRAMRLIQGTELTDHDLLKLFRDEIDKRLQQSLLMTIDAFEAAYARSDFEEISHILRELQRFDVLLEHNGWSDIEILEMHTNWRRVCIEGFSHRMFTFDEKFRNLQRLIYICEYFPLDTSNDWTIFSLRDWKAMKEQRSMIYITEDHIKAEFAPWMDLYLQCTQEGFEISFEETLKLAKDFRFLAVRRSELPLNLQQLQDTCQQPLPDDPERL